MTDKIPPVELNLEDIAERASIFSSLNWDVKKIKNAKIMVIGAGALGNEVLKNLALIGVENILIVDFDDVEFTNLARSILYREEDCYGKQPKVKIASRRLKEINPKLKIMAINGDISLDVGLGVFRRMDAIIGCVDNRLARLYINRFCYSVGKSWIDGGIEDLGGQITVFKPGISCYECQLGPIAKANIRFRMGCGDRAMRYASSGVANTIPITSSIIAAMQVQEALKLIEDPEGKNSLAGQQFFYEGLSNDYMNLPASKIKNRCQSHRRIHEIIPSPLSANSTVKESLRWITTYFGHSDIYISLHYELVLSIKTEKSEKEITFIRPRTNITQKDLKDHQEIEGEEVRIGAKTSEIDRGFPFQDLTLNKLGVPPLHIITVINEGKKHYFELSADENLFYFN